MENKKTVLLAFTGGKKSTVAAYLLLKQGYKVTACSFLMGDLGSSCTLNEIDKAQALCNHLGISHTILDLRSEYSEKVIEPLIAARLSGEDFFPCFDCNILKIESLLKKANDQKIDFIATGHIVNLSKENSTVKIIQAKELKYDQSYFLSGLRENLLEKLILPLGKLTHVEIEKIAISLNLGLTEIRNPAQKCIGDFKKIMAVIEERVPLSLRPEGLIVEEETGMALGQHAGIYNFRLGDKNLGNSNLENSENYSVVRFDNNKKNVLVRKNASFIQDQIKVSKFNAFLDVNLSLPLNCYVALDHADRKIPCKVSLKNNGFAIVGLGKKVEGPIEKGGLLVFYDLIDETSRIIATAFVYEIVQPIDDQKAEGYYIN